MKSRIRPLGWSLLVLLSCLLAAGLCLAADKIEPSVARAVPKLRQAVTTLARATEPAADPNLTGPASSPLLM